MGARERIEMKSLAGINIRCDTIETEDTYIHIYFQINDSYHPELLSSEAILLNESKYQNWGKGITVRFDRDSAHCPPDPNKDHIHLFQKNNQIFALNRDGTAHDGCHGVTISKSICDKIQQHFPDFVIPPNRYIESMEIEDELLNEDVLYLIDQQ